MIDKIHTLCLSLCALIVLSKVQTVCAGQENLSPELIRQQVLEVIAATDSRQEAI